MRRLGVLSNPVAADQFALLLKQKELESQQRTVEGGIEFWLADEDRLDEFRGELQRYERGEYAPISAPPPAPRVPPRRETSRPTTSGMVSRAWELFAPAPWTIFICIACVVATLLTGFFQVPTRFSRALAIIPMNLSGGGGSYLLVDDDPFLWFARGEVWRLFTPALIHAHFLHLLLNLNLFYVFGTVIERVRGSWRLAGLTVLSAVAGNIAQYWWSGPLFCGLSGVGYALYGYIWMKSLFQPETRFVIPRQLHVVFWVWTIICFSGLLPIANGAHSAGLVVGILYGLITVL